MRPNGCRLRMHKEKPVRPTKLSSVMAADGSLMRKPREEIDAGIAMMMMTRKTMTRMMIVRKITDVGIETLVKLRMMRESIADVRALEIAMIARRTSIVRNAEIRKSVKPADETVTVILDVDATEPKKMRKTATTMTNNEKPSGTAVIGKIAKIVIPGDTEIKI
jgi:hypothetical protein